jgi:hypothetical protein
MCPTEECSDDYIHAANPSVILELIAEIERLTRMNNLFRNTSDALMRQWAKTMGRAMDLSPVGGRVDDYDPVAWPDIFAAACEMHAEIMVMRAGKVTK